jgi:hypothetical protein
MTAVAARRRSDLAVGEVDRAADCDVPVDADRAWRPPAVKPAHRLSAMRRGWGLCLLLVLASCGLAWGAVGPWSQSVRLVANVGTTQYGVAVARDGEAVAAWTGRSGVFAAAAPPGLPFGMVTRLSSASIDASGGPLVSIDPVGDAAVVWEQPAGGRRSSDELLLLYRGGGAPFVAPAQRIARAAGSYAIASDAAGDVTLVWQTLGRDGRPTGIDATVRGANGSLGPVRRLATGRNVVTPVLAVDGRGDAIAAWQQGPARGSAIEAASRRAGHAFGRPFTVVKSSVGGEDPNVGIDAHGTAVVAWNGPFDRAPAGIPFKGIQAGFVRVGTSRITHVGSLAGTRRGSLFEIDPQPDVAVNPAGDLLIVWALETTPGGPHEVLEAVQGRIGHAFKIARAIGRSNLDQPPQAAISSSGAAIIAWDNVAGPNRATIAPKRGKPFAKPFALSPGNRLSDGPAVAISPQRAIAVWQDMGPSTPTATGSTDTPLLYRTANFR